MRYDEELLCSVIGIAEEAGREVMKIYSRDFTVSSKSDNSPMTEADRVADDVICAGLKGLQNLYPVLSEESGLPEYDMRRGWQRFWLVDPIDGTKEFIKKNDEFTVNIALVENNEPVMGVVYAPALETVYYGMKGFGAFRKYNGQTVRLLSERNNPRESKKIRVAVSRSHMDKATWDFINLLKQQHSDCSVETVPRGSSLKFCMVAEGTADIYPRFAPTMEWDTGAAQAVAEAAGRNVYDIGALTPGSVLSNIKSGDKLTYNKENLFNPFFIVV